MDGALLSNNKINIVAGANIQNMGVDALSKGTYFIKINTEEGEQAVKFVKE